MQGWERGQGNKVQRKEGMGRGKKRREMFLLHFIYKIHGGQEVGLQHRSKTDSSLKVYSLPEIGREEKDTKRRSRHTWCYRSNVCTVTPGGFLCV